MRRVLVVAFAAGFALGVSHVNWQWGLEHAQVLAGIVTYPAGSPMALQHAAAWSLVSQVAAVGLRAGLSEAALSWWISGLLGAAGCAAVALVVFAVSGRPWASLAALPVLIVSRSMDWGVAYPITLYGTGHTYGAAGLATSTLALGLIGSGAARTGLFLATISLAVHPSLGATTWLVVAGGCCGWWLTDQQAARDWMRRVWPAAIAGLAVVALSLTVHLVLRPDVETVVPADAWPLVHAFVRYWDGHRQPIGWDTGALRLVLGLGVIAAVVAARKLLPPRRDAALLLHCACAAAVAGVLAATMTRIAPEHQPQWLIALMPGRLLNLPLILAIPVLAGLALSIRPHAGGQIQLLLAAALLGSRRSLIWPWLFGFSERGPEPPGVDQLTMAGVFGVVVLVALAQQQPRPTFDELPRWRLPVITRTGAALALILALGATGLVARDAVREWRARRTLLSGSVAETVLAEATAARVILTGGDLLMIQLRTRRPVLLDSGALDVVAYAPASAPAVERLLNEVYGVSLLAPPDGLRPEGRVPISASRAAWQGLTRDDWRRLADKYGFTHVVTHADWGLALDSLATGGGLQTFHVSPDRAR